MTTAAFRKKIWDFYKTNKRDLPWRQTTDPYKILISEVMLQQTQVSRVVPKYTAFLKKFPTVQKLADAPLRDVLALWSGLGYNRRGLNLQKAARTAVNVHGGALPAQFNELLELPGIGPYTAAAVCVFAYSQPQVMIETNIRAVFINEFLPGRKKVRDEELLLLIKKTLPKENPREWYWALMDYGTHLKATMPNPSRRSKHHAKQSTFAGSDRQLRGEVLRRLLKGDKVPESSLLKLDADAVRMHRILDGLVAEGLVMRDNTTIQINTN